MDVQQENPVQEELANVRLNEQQLSMIQLFKTPMPEADFLQMKQLAVQLLAKQLDDEMKRLEQERGWTQETYEQWGKTHMRTPYKK